uniref:ribonuclease H n=1 Tax=Oreochromis niloticus TaxID=8128 RepID=A0A669CP14_ORENI
MGERADMRGKKPLRIRVKDLELVHDFWLADIQDQCIIGLDLLTHWGASVDTAKRAITFGTETLALQCGQKQGEEVTRARRDRCRAAAAQQISGAGGSRSSLLTSAPASQPDKSPSTETTEAVGELWQRSSVGLNVDQRQRLRCLLDENVDIFAASDKDCRQTGLVQHTIDTGSAQPIRLRPHRLPLSKRQVAEEKIREMAAAGVIEPSNSPWAAPVVLVGKKDGSPRFCVDFRRLNAVTKKDSYPLPRIDEALDYVTGSSWFSSHDLRSGYWQVELAPEARPKTAFTIGQGLWQFRVMPFGLCNAPATFERLMERVLVNIPRSRRVVYLDDLLVHGGDFDSALSHLSEVFSAIRRAGLRLNPAKCRLLARETTFLGHVISAQGIATDSAKVAAVRDWPTPSNVKELGSLLGLASYYHRFIKGFATIASPLHPLTDKGQPFGWGDACAAAFAQLKEALTRAPVLAYPDARKPFIVDTDASNVGVGAVLSQQGKAGKRVVAYFSRALGRAERNYCVTRRELLAVVLAVRHFWPYLHGCRFLLRTDHASLTWLLNFKHPEGQVVRWLEVLQGYDFEIQHRAGRQHGNADALSRRPCMAVECRYGLRQEERAQEALGWLLLRLQPAEGVAPTDNAAAEAGAGG